QAVLRLLTDESGATDRTPDRHVNVDVRRREYAIAVTITDRGRTSDPGLGIAIARCIVQADFAGTLACTAADPSETRFELTLPEPGHEHEVEAVATTAPTWPQAAEEAAQSTGRSRRRSAA